MNYPLVLCLITLASSVVIVNGAGKVGKFICIEGGAGFDADMEHTVTVKCPLDVSGIDQHTLENIKTQEDLDAVMAPAMAYHWKCVMGLLKAVDEKGKIIPAKAEAFSKVFPTKHQANAKGKINSCVKNNNPTIKKESGKHAKTWVPFSACMLHVLDLPVC